MHEDLAPEMKRGAPHTQRGFWARCALGHARREAWGGDRRLPPPVTFALAWRWDEYAAVPFASQPMMEALDSIDNPKESTKDEHCGDSDDCVEDKRDGSVDDL